MPYLIRLSLIALVTTLLLPAWAGALSITIGDDAYTLTEPVDFVAVREEFPSLFNSAQRGVPNGHRLVQFYLPSSALTAYRNGERLGLQAYGSLSWVESLGRQVHKVDYIFIRRYVERAYGPQVAANQEAVEQLQYDFLDGEIDNEGLRKRLNNGEVIPAKLIDDDQQTVTMMALQRGQGSSLGEGNDRLINCGMTIIRLKQQVFSLRLCLPYNDNSSLDETYRQVTGWAQRLAQDNP